eukprot:8131112-Pyramimonas_sp.AAC.1
MCGALCDYHGAHELLYKAILEPLYDRLGSSWSHLGPSWGHLGAVRGPLSSSSGRLWPSLDFLGGCRGAALKPSAYCRRGASGRRIWFLGRTDDAKIEPESSCSGTKPPPSSSTALFVLK